MLYAQLRLLIYDSKPSMASVYSYDGWVVNTGMLLKRMCRTMWFLYLETTIHWINEDVSFVLEHRNGSVALHLRTVNFAAR